MDTSVRGQQGDWRRHGACRNQDPDGLFVRGAEQRRVKIVCVPCPVRAHCLAEALDRRIEFGVWGGMTERERRALLRRRPDVADWGRLLVAARRDAVGERSQAQPLASRSPISRSAGTS